MALLTVGQILKNNQPDSEHVRKRQTKRRKKVIPQQTSNLACRKHQRETQGKSQRNATKFTQKQIPRKHTAEESEKTQK